MVTRARLAAIGNFDGVHLGHQFLLEKTIARAGELGAAPAALLFEPHPRRYFAPDAPPFLITASAQRDALLRGYGAEDVIALTFNKALASLTPEAFVNEILVTQLQLRGVVVGADFHFGARRAGNAAILKALGAGAGLDVTVIEILADEGEAEKFGSSAVRAAIAAGEPARAAAMLGRDWSVIGVVEEGQKRGRTIGFPTANFTLGEIIEPRYGVYATRTRIGGETFASVSNFGRRPTVGAPAPLLETHIFDFDREIYGVEIEVNFIEFLRPERKFESFDALKAQIARDCEKARAILA